MHIKRIIYIIFLINLPRLIACSSHITQHFTFFMRKKTEEEEEEEEGEETGAPVELDGGKRNEKKRRPTLTFLARNAVRTTVCDRLMFCK
jgi:hypothetical protein